jgi:2-methylcitrate dehydratase PrpD
MSSHVQSSGVTVELARYAAGVTFATLPDAVKAEAARAFLNWMGCALGGCREEAVKIAAATVAEFGGSPQATIIGHAQSSDVASAAFVNCIASSVLAFDDAHLATVTHPSGPAAASLFAVSQKYAVSGEDFLAALALAIEIECRISNALLLPPSKFNVGFYVTGLSGPIGVAAGIGNLLRLDARGILWAMGIAASQASGFRNTHGTMTAHFRPGHATRAGVWGALLAAKGFTCSDQPLEGEKGFFDVFSAGADLGRTVDGLGRDFEMMRNCYKPYPCGIVIHPTIDACREIRDQLKPDAVITGATLRVHPLTLALTGVRAPADSLEAAISVFHCAAAALLRGRLGLAEMREACINDTAVASLRERVDAVADPRIHSDESIVEANLADGSVVRAHVTVTRGSIERPMTDSELDTKFMDQAQEMLPRDRAEALREVCRDAATSGDIGRDIDAILREASAREA